MEEITASFNDQGVLGLHPNKDNFLLSCILLQLPHVLFGFSLFLTFEMLSKMYIQPVFCSNVYILVPSLRPCIRPKMHCTNGF